MGYQESYIKPRKQKDFEKLKDYIKEISNILDSGGVFPVGIITFNEDREPFIKGDKVIYVIGERYYQSHLIDEFNIPIECNIIFTEYVDPVGIWEDATPNGEYIVDHQPFE